MKRKLIQYFKSLGLDVYTNTKARGHQGFFLNNRIDISKTTKEDRVVPTLLHEFAHYIHHKIEPNMVKSGGTLEVLFDIEAKKNLKQEIKNPKNKNIFGLFQSIKESQKFNNEKVSTPQKSDSATIERELLAITRFVDENSLCLKLKEHKKQIKAKSKIYEEIIKKDYPKFMRSKKFKEFDKYIKKSKARYLLRYDRVKFISPILRKEEIFSIDNIEKDFPDMPNAFCAYIRLKSNTRKQAKVSRRINYLEKYYSKPTELFARFVEGLYIDEARAQALAPYTTQRFFELLNKGHYFELKEVFQLISSQSEKMVSC